MVAPSTRFGVRVMFSNTNLGSNFLRTCCGEPWLRCSTFFSLCCHALFFWYCSLLWDLPAVHKPHNLFEFSLDSTEKHRPFSLLRTGDVLWIYYVFLGAHFKNISRMESPVRWSSSFCNASTLTAICCGNLFNSSAILFKPAGQQ